MRHVDALSRVQTDETNDISTFVMVGTWFRLQGQEIIDVLKPYRIQSHDDFIAMGG